MVRMVQNIALEKIEYVVWKFSPDEKEMNIDGKELIYCQLGKHHHGCQCNHYGDTEEHNLITDKLKQITELFREIDELNKIKK